MARFSQRPKRISRRSESEKFARQVMPAALMCFPVGMLLLLVAALIFLVGERVAVEVLVLAGVVFAVPGFLLTYRFLRGHFSRQLEEP